MDWTPTITGRSGPTYQRIAQALREDIVTGRLRYGQALPTHRALAQALGVDVTTVTRAYAEARKLGLTEARVGRGTFVKAGPAQKRASASPGIDLSMNLPPQPDAADLDGRLARALADIRAEQTFSAYLTYQQPGGTTDEKAVAAQWLQPLVPGVTAERVVISSGTQPALLSLLLSLVAPGQYILTEKLTYPGLKAAAREARIHLIGVDMDQEGLDPKALERACRRQRPEIIYLMPTMHNPTTATMTRQRRSQIAEIIRKQSLTLIEDDPYAFLCPGIAPLATLLPERTYLALSLSKSLAPGLRTSLLVTPDRGAATRLTSALRAAVQMSVPLTVAIATRWMRDGTAKEIIAAIAAEATARQAFARRALAGTSYASHPNAHHIWVPLPHEWSGLHFAAYLQKRGLVVVTADAFATDGPVPNAIRVALGAAQSRDELSRGLEILKEALSIQSRGDLVI